jgi:hypothetical protein
MTPTDYYWERARVTGAERWLLQESWPDSDLERIVGTIVKVKNKHRCRVWHVRRWGNNSFVWETVAVLRDMKADEAKDAAKTILLSQRNSHDQQL